MERARTRVRFARLAVMVAAVAGVIALTACNPELEADLMQKVNSYRVAHGVPALREHPQLTAKARDVAVGMTRSGQLQHSVLSQGIRVRWKLLAENVASGRTVDEAFAALVASPTHRANILDPRFTHAGMGVAVAPDGMLYLAQEFMRA